MLPWNRSGLIAAAMVILWGIAGCQAEHSSAGASPARFDQSAAPGSEYLAETHSVDIEMGEDGIEKSFQATVQACITSTQHACIVLTSDLSAGEYPSASIAMRLNPEGVETMIDTAAADGRVRRRSTQVEDLAEPIIDHERKLAMLEAYHADLLRLREQSSDDVDALIKVAEQVAQVQSQLENQKGQHGHLLTRVDQDLLNISFRVGGEASFWRPIGQAVSSFLDDLSLGIADMITGFAFLLPWIFVMVPLLMMMRVIWRRF